MIFSLFSFNFCNFKIGLFNLFNDLIDIRFIGEINLILADFEKFGFKGFALIRFQMG